MRMLLQPKHDWTDDVGVRMQISPTAKDLSGNKQSDDTALETDNAEYYQY